MKKPLNLKADKNPVWHFYKCWIREKAAKGSNFDQQQTVSFSKTFFGWGPFWEKLQKCQSLNIWKPKISAGNVVICPD